MRGWGKLGPCLAVCGVATAVACGGTVETTGPGSSVGDGSGGAGTGGWPSWTGGTGAIVDAGPSDPGDVRSDYTETECPDVPPLPVEQWCDLTDPHADCSIGEACYPFVEYPDPSDNCAQERYGTVCVPEGSGRQGDPCEAGDCAGGFICVLTGQGTQCIEICNDLGVNTCPAGFFCIPVDVQPGVGGCY